MFFKAILYVFVYDKLECSLYLNRILSELKRTFKIRGSIKKKVLLIKILILKTYYCLKTEFTLISVYFVNNGVFYLFFF